MIKLSIIVFMTSLMGGYSGLVISDVIGEDVGKLEVSNAWARASPPASKMAAVYLTLSNSSLNRLKLLRVDTDRSKSAHMHKTQEIDGVSRMKKLERLSLDSGETKIFAPGGMHIMLGGVMKPLIEGDSFDLEITYTGDSPGIKEDDIQMRTVKIAVQVVSISQVNAP